MDLKEWATSHKGILAAGAIGTVGGLLFFHSRANKAAQATSAISPALVANGPSGFTAGIDPLIGPPYGYITPPGYVPGSGGAGGGIVSSGNGGTDSGGNVSQAPAPAQPNWDGTTAPAGFTSHGFTPAFPTTVGTSSPWGPNGTVVELGYAGPAPVAVVSGPTTTGTHPYTVEASNPTPGGSLGPVIPAANAVAGEQYVPGPTPGTLQVVN